MLPFETSNSILIGAGLATTGWVYTSRLARNLSKKQHTINIILRASFDQEMREAHQAISPYLKPGSKLPSLKSAQFKKISRELRLVLNHFEWVAAGIRRGDIDEALIMDAERGMIVTAFEKCEDYIHSLRDSRRRASVYEQLEWLYERWEKSPPGKCLKVWERLRGRPNYGRRNKVR